MPFKSSTASHSFLSNFEALLAFSYLMEKNFAAGTGFYYGQRPDAVRLSHLKQLQNAYKTNNEISGIQFLFF